MKFFNRAMMAAAALGLLAAPAWAIDGLNIPTDFQGYLVASQANATAWGNHVVFNEEGILVGSEMDSLWVSADATDLWIGIPGNLPNKLGGGQSIVILLQLENDPAFPPYPYTLNTNALDGFGGGWQAAVNLHGTVLDPGFYPDNIVVVNRFAESTYVNSWYLPTNAQDEWFEDLISIDPYNGRYLSVWMDTTNTAGVDSDEVADGAGQQALAVTATKGLRIRLSRSYFGIGNSIKIMVLLTAQDGTVSNQILPPLSTTDDPPAPNCLGNTPNFDETYDPIEDPPVVNPGYAGPQFWPVDLSINTGTPDPLGGFDGSDIRGAWPTGTEAATQQIHTCFGDAVPGMLVITQEGSELDQLFVRADEQFLHIGLSGNLEPNSNKLIFWLDTEEGGENTLDANGPNEWWNPLWNWAGRTFDPGFAPDYALVVNNSGGTFHVDHYALAGDVQRYLGNSVVNGDSGVLQGGDNPNGNEFVLNHTNDYGVVGTGDPGQPGDPATATSGIEAKIALAELGLTASVGCGQVKIMVVLASGNSAYISNQLLPSLASGSNDSVGDDGDPPTPQFNFGLLDPEFGGSPAFAGDQFATVTTIRRLGDVQDDGDCCINLNDLSRFVLVLLGQDTSSDAVYYSDMNGVGGVNGEDIQLFVDALLAEGPCPP